MRRPPPTTHILRVRHDCLAVRRIRDARYPQQRHPQPADATLGCSPRFHALIYGERYAVLVDPPFTTDTLARLLAGWRRPAGHHGHLPARSRRLGWRSVVLEQSRTRCPCDGRTKPKWRLATAQDGPDFWNLLFRGQIPTAPVECSSWARRTRLGSTLIPRRRSLHATRVLCGRAEAGRRRDVVLQRRHLALESRGRPRRVATALTGGIARADSCWQPPGPARSHDPADVATAAYPTMSPGAVCLQQPMALSTR